eukprot:gene20305-39667_t
MGGWYSAGLMMPSVGGSPVRHRSPRPWLRELSGAIEFAVNLKRWLLTEMDKGKGEAAAAATLLRPADEVLPAAPRVMSPAPIPAAGFPTAPTSAVPPAAAGDGGAGAAAT